MTSTRNGGWGLSQFLWPGTIERWLATKRGLSPSVRLAISLAIGAILLLGGCTTAATKPAPQYAYQVPPGYQAQKSPESKTSSGWTAKPDESKKPATVTDWMDSGKRMGP
jgi:hypothetical protein